jgi:hypothetical protein
MYRLSAHLCGVRVPIVFLLLLFLAAPALADTPGRTSVWCLPKITWPLHADYGDLPAGVSTRATAYAGWICDLPTGYRAVVILYSPREATNHVYNAMRGLLTLDQANAACASSCWSTFTTAEQTFSQAEAMKIAARAVVAFNGGKLTRKTFKANPDGTLNATPVGTASVAAWCNPEDRLAGTSYYAVQDGTYTICTVSLPFGSN